MKSILITLLCALTIASYGSCVAYGDNRAPAYLNSNTGVYLNRNTGVYLKGFGGVNLAHEPSWNHAQYRTSVGYAIGTALGYNFGFVSAEGEFSYRYNSLDRLVINALDMHVSGHIHQWCGFANLLLNVPLTSCFAPYVGVGAGYRHMKPGVNFDESSDISFQNFVDSSNEWGVYQVIAGLNFAVSGPVRLHVEYRYVNGWSNIKCSNHTVDLGAGIQF